jgi:hypothetical protein
MLKVTAQKYDTKENENETKKIDIKEIQLKK